MKKLFLILLIVCILLCNGCNKRENIYSDNICEGYQDKYAYLIQEDGWVHTMEISYMCDGSISYIYDAFNVKYKHMKDYTIQQIYQDGTIKEVESDSVSFTNNKKYIDELYDLDDFFKEKKFSSTITADDLKEVNLKNLDSNIISDVFNLAINSERKTKFGSMVDKPFFTINEKKIGNYTIRLAILIFYGYIEVVNFEIIDQNNIYISDLVRTNKATKKQREIYNNLLNIANKIKESNSLDVQIYFPKLTDGFYKEIFKFMENYYL